MKITVTCKDCGKEREIDKANKTAAMRRQCHSCAQKKLQHHRYPPSRKGINSGLGYIGSDGYRMVNVGIKVYKREHRLVLEQNLNRELLSTETVHHINLVKLDNRLDNLFLCESENEHGKIHKSLDSVVTKLVDDGIIVFNRNIKSYEVAHLKLRELLEPPKKDNQQPSLTGNSFEGSETRSESRSDNNSSTSSEQVNPDDIVRTVQ